MRMLLRDELHIIIPIMLSWATISTITMLIQCLLAGATSHWVQRALGENASDTQFVLVEKGGVRYKVTILVTTL